MFLIREKHPRIDLFGIDFPSLRGVEIPNQDDSEDEDVEVEDQDQEVSMNDLFDAGNDPQQRILLTLLLIYRFQIH